MTAVLGDFNAKSSNWCKADVTSLGGSKIDTITSSYGSNQLIQEPTHILSSSSSCTESWNLEFIHRCTEIVTIR